MIDSNYAELVCRYKDGSKMCRYLAIGDNGFECLKHTSLKESIDKKCNDGVFMNVGDNCAGFLCEEDDTCQRQATYSN